VKYAVPGENRRHLLTSTLGATGAPSNVSFFPLGRRPDGDGWVVGRASGENYFKIPSVGMRAIDLLETGLTIEATRVRINGETGHDCDVTGFVSQLAELGMVDSIDGRRISSAEPIHSTLSRVEQRHVEWLFRPIVIWLVGTVITLGVVAAILRPSKLPKWSDLVWSDHGTPVLLLESILAWILILLHELAHLLTARAAGVPGRMKLGTRLQFLVAETDISGIWLCSRRLRLTTYLAGMASDAVVSSLCLIVMVATNISPLILKLVILNKMISFLSEFMVFTRTDVYFVIQDLSRCNNLYGDALAYLRFLYRRLTGKKECNPLFTMPERERQIIRTYAVLMSLGSTVSLGIGVMAIFYFSGPLLYKAIGNVTSADWINVADGVTTLTLTGGMQILWVSAWWRRHGRRTRQVLSGLARRSTP
jgi:putative peptide zinc metalloprotease protein